MNFMFLDQAADRLNREFKLGERATPRKVAVLAKKLGWRTRKIYGLRAIAYDDLVKHIETQKAAR